MRWIAVLGLTGVIGLFFAHRLVASRPIDATISLAAQETSTGEPGPVQPAKLHVGIAQMTSPVTGFRSHQALAERLGAALNVEVELLTPDSYKAINALLRESKLDVAFVCSGGYVAEPDAMDVLAAPLINGKMEYFGFIIVPQNSPCRTFSDLRGKSFLFVEEQSNTGQWFPCKLACHLAGKRGAFFSSTKFTGAHDISILAIASNLADGAAVSSNIYDRMIAKEPALKDRIRILEKSPAFPSPPVVVRKTLPQDMRQRLLRVLVTLHEADEGREILRGLGFDKFVPAGNEDYGGIEPCTLGSSCKACHKEK
ncbi:MAG: phosphate/phosphite/phosphonate ABC transporter substrate-binding protein [Planctomycetota bacterium]